MNAVSLCVSQKGFYDDCPLVSLVFRIVAYSFFWCILQLIWFRGLLWLHELDMYECAGLQVPLPSRLLASAVSCIYGFRNQELLTSTGPYTDGFLHCSVTLRKSDGSFIFVMLKCNRLITCRFLCISSRLVRRLI